MGQGLMKIPTDIAITELADAMAAVLNDMGKEGRLVTLWTKARARIAYEPFISNQDRDWTDKGMMSLDEAQRLDAIIDDLGK